MAQAVDPAGNFEKLSYTGQAFQADAGRPDIVGYDSSGWRLMIEAKFDAGLTAPQAGTQYVDMLKEGGGMGRNRRMSNEDGRMSKGERRLVGCRRRERATFNSQR